MAQRNYLISTTALSTTASGTTISSGNTQSATFELARTLVRTGIGAGEFPSGTQTWAVHYVVSAMTTPYEMRLKVQRRNSSGVMQAESGFGTTRSATGTYDDNLSADLGTWAANDQLALVWEHRRPSGTGNKSGTVDANGASYIDAPTSDVSVALSGVSSTASVGSLTPDISAVLAGSQVTSAVGTLTKVVEERFVFDTYTDTESTTLASHTPDIGGSLTLHGSFSDTVSIQSNRAGKDGGTATSAYYYSVSPSGLEYTIEADIVDVGDVNRAAGIAGWIDTSADHMVVARRQNSTTWQLLKIISGSATSIDTEAVTFSAGAVRRIKLVRSTGDSFEWFIDGVSLGSFTISDSQFQSPGKVGLRASNIHTATGYHIDNFSAYELVSPDVTVGLTGVSSTLSLGSVTAGATPTAPSALSLLAMSSHEVMLTWTDNANNETSFRIERKTGAGGTYAEIGSTTKNVIAFYDTTASANTTYFYRVRARNATGDSDYLTEQSITTPVAGSTVTIMSVNLQHGQGTDNAFNYQRQVDAMAGADIVCVQERSTSETGWDSPMSNAGLTQQVFKAHAGSAGDGNAIWTTSAVTVSQTYTFDMVQTNNNPTSGSATIGWDGSTDVRRSFCAIKAQVGGKQFYVVSLHFVAASGEDSSNTNFSVQRVDQINSALGWIASNLTGGLDVILAGDFNIPINYPRAPERSFTADSTTDVITSTAHGFSNGTGVALRNSGGAVPGGLAAGDSLYAQAPVYYVRDATTDTFKLAATRGGAAIDLTSNGSGSNFVCATQWSLFIEAGYDDQWQDGLLASKASAPFGDRDENSTEDMPLSLQLTRTHDTRHIDHCVVLPSAGDLTLRHINIPDLRAQCSTSLSGNTCSDVAVLTGTPDDMGVRPSDHNFVKAAFDISPDIALALSGVSGAVSLGSLNQSRDTALSGASATSATGSLGVDYSLALPGVVATLAAGTLTPNINTELSGVSTSGATGVVTSGNVVVVSGFESAAALDILSPNITITAAGLQITTAVGTVTAESGTNDITLGLSGVESTTATGVLSAASQVELSGNESVTAIGVVTVTTGDIQLELAGIENVFALGLLGVDHSQDVIGAEVTTSTGTVAPEWSTSVSGQTSAAEIGSVTFSIGVLPSGHSVTSEAGSVSVTSVVSPSGVSATGQTGTVVAETDTSKSLALTGVNANCAAGALTVDFSLPTTGVDAVTSLGSIGLSKGGSVALSGFETPALLGSLALDNSLALNGAESSSAIGGISLSHGPLLAGMSVTGSIGSLLASSDVGLTGAFSTLQLGTVSTAFVLWPGKTVRLKPETRTIILPAESRTVKI